MRPDENVRSRRQLDSKTTNCFKYFQSNFRKNSHKSESTKSIQRQPPDLKKSLTEKIKYLFTKIEFNIQNCKIYAGIVRFVDGC